MFYVGYDPLNTMHWFEFVIINNLKQSGKLPGTFQLALVKVRRHRLEHVSVVVKVLGLLALAFEDGIGHRMAGSVHVCGQGLVGRPAVFFRLLTRGLGLGSRRLRVLALGEARGVCL